MSNTENLVKVARELSQSVCSLSFEPPTTYIYNPLEYAWGIHRQYLELAGGGKKKVVFLGSQLCIKLVNVRLDSSESRSCIE